MWHLARVVSSHTHHIARTRPDKRYSWTFNFDEDPYGEIDIIENINTESRNIVSLHTCGECNVTLTGTNPRPDCNLGGESRQCVAGADTN